MTVLDQIALRIIREQELVVGPLAWKEASKVQGLRIVDQVRGEVTLSESDPKETVNHLVARYERLFGRASHEVCRDAVASIIAELPQAEIPSSLQT